MCLREQSYGHTTYPFKRVFINLGRAFDRNGEARQSAGSLTESPGSVLDSELKKEHLVLKIHGAARGGLLLRNLRIVSGALLWMDGPYPLHRAGVVLAF